MLARFLLILKEFEGVGTPIRHMNDRFARRRAVDLLTGLEPEQTFAAGIVTSDLRTRCPFFVGPGVKNQ